MEYILIDDDNRVASIVTVDVGHRHHMNFPEDEYDLVVTDSSGIGDDGNWHDWRYDAEAGEFVLDPEEERIEYVDVATGETVAMTQDEFDAMVDEKVRNNVVAVLNELAGADEALARKILNP